MTGVLIVIYVWIRFGDLKYGSATIASLVHDVLFMAGALGFAHLLAGTAIGHALLLHPFRVNLTMVSAFLAIIGATVGVIVYMGHNTYYVGVQDDQVAIFRGRPGGVLWIEPELAEPTGIAVAQVPAASVAAVKAGVEEASLDDARRYVANLQEQIDRATTTTTTSATTTTTVAAAPVTLAPG